MEGRDATIVVRGVCVTVVTVFPGPDRGDTLAIDINDGDDFSCGCSGENIRRRGDRWSCVLANVDTRHRRQVGQVQGSHSRSH